LLTGILFLLQTVSSGDAIIRTKDIGDISFGHLTALLNVYGGHIRGPRTSTDSLLLRLCLVWLEGGGGLWIELLVTLDTGRQIRRPRLPVSNRSLHARVRSGGLGYGNAGKRQQRTAYHAHAESDMPQPRAHNHWVSAAARQPILRTRFGCSLSVVTPRPSFGRPAPHSR
jgi:hypothetical protein